MAVPELEGIAMLRIELAPDWLFQGIENATRREIFCWWEARRFDYNLYVGLVGIVTWFLVLVAGAAAVKPGVDFEEPIAMIVGPFVYGLVANLCYSAGSVIDLAIYRRRSRVHLFKIGLIFSISLTALPGIWALVAWLITVVTRNKLD
jgi:hypothetical protein